jgi:dTMP kinase
MLKPSIGLERIKSNKKREFNRIDAESLKLHNKVYLGYKKLVKKYPKNIVMIDANQKLDLVVKKIIKIIDKKLINYA